MSIQEVRIATGDGDLKAALALPSEPDAQAPGVIVLHELFGLNDDIRRIARRFADNGYVALAPDLYSVGPRLKPICIRRTMQALRSGRGRAFDDIEAARAWLVDRGDVDESRLAVAGFCLGGGFAILEAARAPLGAAAGFYGAVPRETEALQGSCPVFAAYGEKDRVFVGQAARLRGHLEQLGVEHEINVYPGAGHSFMSRYWGVQGFLVGHSRMSVGYHHESAEAAWTTMLDFFDRHLGGTNTPTDSSHNLR